MKCHFKVVFFTPEALLLKKKWRNLLITPTYSNCLRAVVVDEAHTVKKWGETFRSVLLKIGELRSLVPSSVHMLALTATATRPIREEVIKVLGMKSPSIVAVSPCKPNIMYMVKSYDSIEEAFGTILKGIKKQRGNFPRTIIYCQKLSDCGRLYLYFKKNLGKEFVEPLDAPDLPQFRLVDMYHSSTDPIVKESILKLFCLPSNLRIVISTVAFGMGIDCHNVEQVVHLGQPESVESYIQEIGRAGRNGAQSLAVLMLVKGVVIHHAELAMKQYISNKDICRRQFLFSFFEGYTYNAESLCVCCDVCASLCTCTECDQKHERFCVC